MAAWEPDRVGDLRAVDRHPPRVALSCPLVHDEGHVAAWIGVGGAGMGPGGSDEWDGGVAGSCNGYDFDFSNLAVRAQYAGGWQAFDLSRVLRDPAYAIKLRPSSFTATSR